MTGLPYYVGQINAWTKHSHDFGIRGQKRIFLWWTAFCSGFSSHEDFTNFIYLETCNILLRTRFARPHTRLVSILRVKIKNRTFEKKVLLCCFSNVVRRTNIRSYAVRNIKKEVPRYAVRNGVSRVKYFHSLPLEHIYLNSSDYFITHQLYY